MQFFTVPMLFAAMVAAKASFTNTDFDVEAGKPFKLTWDGASGPVTILLKSGPSGNLKTVSTLTSGANGKEFTFTPDGSLPKDLYAFEIDDGTEPNYSAQFPLGSGAAPSSAASAASSATSTVAKSSYAVSSTFASSTITATASSSASASSASASAPASASVSGSSSSAASVSMSASASASKSASSSAASTPTTLPNTNGAASAFAPLALLAGAAALVL
ncbi:uncharacterized protein PG986_008119 [Apiospora aurea]|uniref:Yeast cell wall synthesis Kre9/Knh1-like N-terminal domain-containing protein n=1 Tax=Apiospora aurea TaxID=335848 RepID=A0ABR1QEI0_9PEZI